MKEKKKIIEFEPAENKVSPILRYLLIVSLLLAVSAIAAVLTYHFMQISLLGKTSQLPSREIKEIHIETIPKHIEEKLSFLETRLGALEGKISFIENDIALAKQNNTRELKVIAFMNLSDAISKGRPFKQELVHLSSLIYDDKTASTHLAKLEPFADKGIRTLESLKNDFNQIANALVVKSQNVNHGNSFLDRLKGFLSRFIVIRRVGDNITGESTEATVAKAEILIKNNRLEETIKVLDKISGEVKIAAFQWLEEANDRLIVEQGLDALHQHLTRLPGST